MLSLRLVIRPLLMFMNEQAFLPAGSVPGEPGNAMPKLQIRHVLS